MKSLRLELRDEMNRLESSLAHTLNESFTSQAMRCERYSSWDRFKLWGVLYQLYRAQQLEALDGERDIDA